MRRKALRMKNAVMDVRPMEVSVLAIVQPVVLVVDSDAK